MVIRATLAQVLVAWWGLVFNPATGGAEIFATFAGGDGSAHFDQFPGSVGGGWGGAWVTQSNQPALEQQARLSGENPLSAAGGNYLVLERRVRGSDGDGQVRSGAARLWEEWDGVTRTADLEFRWKVRVDEAERFEDETADALIFLEDGRRDPGGRALPHNGGSVDSTTWHVELRTRQGRRVLRVLNGSTAQFVPWEWQMGVVYEFVVVSRPSSRTWELMVYDTEGSVLVERQVLAWRARELSTHSGGWAAVIGLKRGPGREGSGMRISLDDVIIRAAATSGYAWAWGWRTGGRAGQVFPGTQIGSSTKFMGWLGMPRWL